MGAKPRATGRSAPSVAETAAFSLVLFLAVSLPLALLVVRVVIDGQVLAEAISQVASPTLALVTIASGGRRR